VLSFLLQSCDPSPQPSPPPPPPAVEAYSLIRHPEDLVELTISPLNRPAGGAPEVFDPPMGWQYVGSNGEHSLFEGAMPVAVRIARGDVPAGLTVVDADGNALPISEEPEAYTWLPQKKRVILRMPAGEKPTGYGFVHPDSTENIDAMNLATSGMEPVDFAIRTLKLFQARRRGLYLPAPSTAAWDVTLPDNAKLTCDTALLKSRLYLERTSDGASVIAEIEADGVVTEVGRTDMEMGDWKSIDADLSAWSGQRVRVRFRTLPGGHNTSDYVHIGEPTIYAPKEHPRRIVMVFIDTLRQDRLGVYGYERPTTPNIDAFASSALVFDEARSVAPWTYPAMRAALSGQLPDHYEDGPSLPERLARSGFVTVAYVNNAFLSSDFDMDEGWGWHFYDSTFTAEQQVNNAIGALEKTTDRDMLLMIQLMDVHLPYAEPEPYRSMWAGEEPEGLRESFRRGDIVRRSLSESEKTWLSDRYDQSLRHLDTRLGRLLSAVGPEDTVILFSDHGEELFDHGGYEHGHTLYDELLRVPLIIADQNVRVGRSDAAASLLDLTPTILDLAGLPADASLAGHSLLSDIPDRPLPAGFTLYGADTWGVIQRDRKWLIRDGETGYYDLTADPEERTLIPTDTAASTADFVAAMSAALDRPVVPAWRLVAGELPQDRPERVQVSAPGGLKQTWTGLESPQILPPELREDGEKVTVFSAPGGLFPREVFTCTATPGEPLTVQVDDEEQTFTTDFSTPTALLGRLGRVTVTTTLTPLHDGARLKTADAAVAAQLRELGYLEE
jgi:arylsulfatase A-like enzyme